MNLYAMKSFLIGSLVLSSISLTNAQFDDVYYDPDNITVSEDGEYYEDTSDYTSEDEYGVT